MNKIIQHIIPLKTLTLLVVVCALFSCTKESNEFGEIIPADYLMFSTSVNGNSTKSSGRSTSGHLSIVEDEWALDGKDIATKGTLMTQLGGSAGVIGYLKPTEEAQDVELWDNVLDNKEFEFDGDELRHTGDAIPWKDIESKCQAIKFYVFAPKNLVTESAGLTLSMPESDIPSLSYTVPDDVNEQNDIISAYTQVASNFRMSVPLQFKHILTGIRFKTGFECTVKSVTLKNIACKGTYNMEDGAWQNESETKNFTTQNSGDTFILLPQSFNGEYSTENEPVVELQYEENGITGTIFSSLKEQEWEPGKLITYTIYKSDAIPDYIYFDLAAGDVNISDSGYSGVIYVNGEKQAITGDHSSSNRYYVYQSTKENYTQTGWATSINIGECRVPTYPEVYYNGKPWKEYITNNSVVEDVIHNWDNREGTAGAVRSAGRESTLNKISIKSLSTECHLIIDNLYSTFQQRSTSRTNAGISYIPNQSNGHLYIKIVGDNRFGAIHYSNSKSSNSLVFEGNGSLTVADTDYNCSGNIASNSYYIGVSELTTTTYTSNHWNSAIGNSDSGNDSYGIIIKSGTIFAGTTAAENCSAIGAGGNGKGVITIDGGVVTAVATTTGTAIGGGIGFTDTGGEGNVTINGGDVYAYNHANRWNIPSSAIGGAGSSMRIGGYGSVTINGGNVYAESGIGTAIGGGSSASQKGGNAGITIRGGTVIAKSVEANGIAAGAGIGGGSGSSTPNTDINATDRYGGTAVITISGNPVIRTGSIGGGKTGAKYSKIGSAVIKISDTPDIQAQFVMAAGANTPPSFEMTGGVIRNSYTSDKEYFHIQPNGGAVYMEEGTLKMSGGSIKNCSAEEGGAIYITGGEAIISGNASLSGNLASGGNGGAVCIYNGNFEMDGTASVKDNSAQFRNGKGGNGGGIYVSSTSDAEVSVLQGSITGNTADRFGGGIAVDMKQSTATAKIVIGKEETGSQTNPDISGNHTLILGGGLYANGSKADVTINSGRIKDNSTSGYTYNEDVANEGGMVTLNGGDVTHVVVTFNGNGGMLNGNAEYTQNIVTSTNSILVQPASINRTGYNFTGWNTRADGNGTQYSNGATMNLSANLVLYAQWSIIN